MSIATICVCGMSLNGFCSSSVKQCKLLKMSEKKYPIGGYAPGNYHNRCSTCERSFFGDKRATQCEPCALNDRAKFDALSPSEQEELMKRNAQVMNEIFSKARTLTIESPAEQPVAKIDRDWINDALVEFALWYHKSPRKDIANDSCEYLNDKLKEAGIEYIISEDERIIAPEQPVREVEAVTFTDWVKHNTKGYDPIVEKWVYGENEYRYTTTELYNLFKGRPAEWSGEKEVKP